MSEKLKNKLRHRRSKKEPKPPLSQSERDRLKDMKLDNLKSTSIESEINDLVELVQIVDWLEKAGDIAVQFSPPRASLPWSMLKMVMQIPVIDEEQMAALLGVTEQVIRIITRDQVYEDVYLIDNRSQSEPEDKLSKQLQCALAHTGAILNPGKVSGGLSDISEQEDQLLRHVNTCESRRSQNADARMVKC
ncbi:hypothetical protein BDW59DRAFT_160300 [Aspergillus cavernicola]|uniref:Uncharacterized protein n=1 Tax=Aspergillus cavernicola TaxID=176166 RepID=A0ABR4IHT3_9EURO